MSRNFRHIFDGNAKNFRRRAIPAYIGFGSNQGNRRRKIEFALRALTRAPGVSLTGVSSLYETEPVGGPPQRSHANGVARLDVRLSPPMLLRLLHHLERQAGRRRGIKWGPRPLDLDILAYGRGSMRTGSLQIPHPRYHLRRFVLVPFSEIAPRFQHPRLKRSNAALLRRLTVIGQRVTMLARWKNGRYYPSKKRKA